MGEVETLAVSFTVTLPIDILSAAITYGIIILLFV